MSWDPYYQGKRTIVYVSPLAAVLCVIALVGFVTLAMNPHLKTSLLSFRSHGASGGIPGEWVGTLDISEVRDSHTYVHTPVNKRAAILLKLGVTDSALREFGGKGKMQVQGEPGERSITISRLGLEADGIGSTYRAEISSDGNTWNKLDNSDSVSGYVKGSLNSDVLEMQRSDTSGYQFHGTLQRGTSDRYQALVKSLR